MIILYPTETTYGLGVNALDPDSLKSLYELKERDPHKICSWLVEDVNQIANYAVLTKKAEEIASQYFPGPVTLILKALDSVDQEILGEDRTIGFRISSDPIAMKLVHELGFPLTATSANVSGFPTLPTPPEILNQFGLQANMITRVIDDGPRSNAPSTVVRCIGDTCDILRKGAVDISSS